MKPNGAAAWVRPFAFIAITAFVVLWNIGCRKKDQVNTTSTEVIRTTEDVLPSKSNDSASITQAMLVSVSNAPSIPGFSPVPASADGGSLTPLPEFTTYLVNLSSVNSVGADLASELGNLCALLKQQTSIPEINAIMDCRLRSDNPLLADESASRCILSFYFHNSELQSEKLSIEGWNTLKPPQGEIGVIDFKSPQNSFERFRIVTFPTGSANQPVKLPASLLRADQIGLLASFEKPLAGRIAKLTPYSGYLQLRPFLRSESGARDLIEALPQPYQAMTASGNELNFTRLRTFISNAQSEKVSRLREVDNRLSLYSDSFDRRYLPARMQKQLAEAKQGRALLEASIEADRACLTMIPARLLDPRLDHVALFFVTGSSGKTLQRIELIRFEGSGAALERGK
jgi:hypothetical protein